jgi:transcriptional regulator with XRE-family HTH domain
MGTPSLVGRKLRTLRRRRKLTLRGLSVLAGVPHSTIHGLEHGYWKSASIATGRRLAVALGADLADFVPALRRTD